MRFVLPLVALCAFSSAPLRADMFNITLSGDLSGSGTFTTDEICLICEPGAGLLSLTINIGPDTGTDAFDISDDVLGPVQYVRFLNDFTYLGLNSETGDALFMNISNWNLTRAGSTLGSGTYSVAAVPEPSSLFLFMPTVALFVGLCYRGLGRFLRRRHQQHARQRTVEGAE